jgi:hypothetical protein
MKKGIMSPVFHPVFQRNEKGYYVPSFPESVEIRGRRVLRNS